MLKQEGTCCEKKSEKKQESPAFKAGHNKVRRHLQKGENTMKRRDFMKLSAATALGATVAAMAPSALAATELDQTNGDLHTTVDRKTAAMGLGDGKTFAYDPENPYLNVNVGLFHDAQVMVGGQNVGPARWHGSLGAGSYRADPGQHHRKGVLRLGHRPYVAHGGVQK